MSAPPIAIVVYEKLAADGDEVAEEVDQRLALHSRIMMASGFGLRASDFGLQGLVASAF
jgi:hypothetical protein